MQLRLGSVAALGILFILGLACAPTTGEGIKLEKLDRPDPKAVELGQMLFFDTRLSGDGSLACSSCHDPKKGFADGMPLSAAYPGSKYFRNAKTVINTRRARYFYWDGRLSGQDIPTMVRDHITETHFMNLDGRLMLERLKQIPEYDARYKEVMGGEPSFGRTLNAVAAFLESLESKNVPFDNGSMSPEAKRGYRLFTGKAKCASCHSGAMFSDYQPHQVGVPAHPSILEDPERHFTLRAWAKFLGTPNFENIREDPGFFVVSKEAKHLGAFVTPTLRELKHTAPYMHNGTLPTLEAVVGFKNKGGGDGSELEPLGLTQTEQADLVAFLNALSGDPFDIEAPTLPQYAPIEDWLVKEN